MKGFQATVLATLGNNAVILEMSQKTELHCIIMSSLSKTETLDK